jgi:membrane-bound lytic murein transglycosylase A
LIETGEAVLALKREGLPPAEFTERLKKDFDLFRIQGGSQPPGAFFSSYYLPVLEASTACQGAFAFPIYRKPPDLVEADLGAFNPKWKGETLVGRMTPEGRFVPYFDRGAVDVRGALAGKGLEIACLKGAFERLDLHIQGSGLLELPDKTLKLARFSATNALPYRSVGLALAGSGAVRREELDRARLRQYLAEHPEGEAWLLSQNPRYTFFELVDVPPDGEPFGRADQPLTAGRSIAVDPKFAPLGSLAFLRLETVQTDASGAFLGRSAMSRLAFCQDIGGAIQGPGRVDIYSGHGAQAFSQASKIWDPGELYLLLKRLPARQR